MCGKAGPRRKMDLTPEAPALVLGRSARDQQNRTRDPWGSGYTVPYQHEQSLAADPGLLLLPGQIFAELGFPPDLDG